MIGIQNSKFYAEFQNIRFRVEPKQVNLKTIVLPLPFIRGIFTLR